MPHRTTCSTLAIAAAPLLALVPDAARAADVSGQHLNGSPWLAFLATLAGGLACSVAFVAVADRALRARLHR